MVISRNAVIVVMYITFYDLSACTAMQCPGIMKALFLLKNIQHISLAYKLNTPGKFIGR